MKNNLLGYVSDKIQDSLKALYSNKVVLMFVVLCLFGITTTGKPVSYTVVEVFTRFGRNTFLVLALIIPVLAGLGLNFGIVVGAMAAQIAIFWTVYWGFTGIKGLLICVVLATPIAIFFGWLVGRLYNKTKGAEMITGLILAYFADGLYQFFFLFLIGGVIPVNNPTMIIAGGTGVKNTIDLANNLKYSIDTINMLTVVRMVVVVYVVMSMLVWFINKKKALNLQRPFKKENMIGSALLFSATFIPFVNTFMSTDRLQLSIGIPIGCVLAMCLGIYKIAIGKLKKEEGNFMVKNVAMLIAAALILGLSLLPGVSKVLWAVHLPVAIYALIALLCFFNSWLLQTKMGQDMRTVGQSRTVANAAGINVNRTRIIAMCMSTTLAAWGQIIYLQNLGTFATYGAHTMCGLYAIAALLVGGASVQHANNKQAILGVFLFHTLFVVAPLSASTIFGSALIGEYFRVFICYGVIALSLAMHAWKSKVKVNGQTDNENKGKATHKPLTQSTTVAE
ncbi:MAG: ABC transporter permease [Clostridia bacterium]|nr:ABC transporter permease [Clostridia bacterium]